MTFKFKYRRRFFWTTVVVNGNKFDPTLDRMVLFLPDGGVREICKWSGCDVHLGQDWVLAQKKAMEGASRANNSGQGGAVSSELEDPAPWESDAQMKGFGAYLQWRRSTQLGHHLNMTETKFLAAFMAQKNHEAHQWWAETVAAHIKTLQDDILDLRREIKELRTEVARGQDHRKNDGAGESDYRLPRRIRVD